MLRHRTSSLIVAASSVLTVSGCSAPAQDHGGPRTLLQAPRVEPPAPHRVASGAHAGAVFKALQDLHPGEGMERSTYEFAELDCVFLSGVVHPPTVLCTLTQRADGGAPSSKRVGSMAPNAPEAPLAEALGETLREAGAELDILASKMPLLRLRNVRATKDRLEFDDDANLRLPPVPNATVEGSAADDILETLARAGIKEDDGSMLVICNTWDGRPSCSYRLRHGPEMPFGRTESTALWRSLLDVAPLENQMEKIPSKQAVTVIHASHFTYDRKTLSLVLTPGTGTPPTPPATPPPEPPRPAH